MNYYKIVRPLSKNTGIAGFSLLLSDLLLLMIDFFTPIDVFVPGVGFFFVTILFIGLIASGIGLIFFVPILIFERQAITRIEKVLAEIGEITGFERKDEPPYLLINSVDRVILQSVTDLGGDIVAIEDNMTQRALIPEGESQARKLAQLQILGLIAIPEKSRRIFLTPLGMDALNIPATLLVSRIPLRIWEHLFQEKIAIWGKKWGNAVVETAKALEEMMRDKINELKENEKWEEVSRRNSNKPIKKWAAGNLLQALVSLDYIKRTSLEYNLANELVQIRNKVHPKDELHTFSAGDADKCDTYIGLLVKSWYGPR